MQIAVATVVGLVGALAAMAQVPVAAPAFSGAWVYDASKSAALVSSTEHRTPSPLLGDECVIDHTPGTLAMIIRAGAMTVEASYRLDGGESRNLSPGPPGQPHIPILSRARWVGAVLEIQTSSESDIDGRKVPVESVRRLWLTVDGNLAIERRGTPANLVPTSAGVYRRK